MIRYPMIVPGGHPAAEALLGGEVYAEIRHPGQRVGFALVQTPAQGELWIDMPAHQVELVPAVELLNPDYHYVATLLRDPSRLVLTDVMTEKGPLDHEAKFVEADRIGMECVQLLHAGVLESPQQLMDLLAQAPDGLILKPVKVSRQQRLLYAEITADMFTANDAAPGPDGVPN